VTKTITFSKNGNRYSLIRIEVATATASLRQHVERDPHPAKSSGWSHNDRHSNPFNEMYSENHALVKQISFNEDKWTGEGRAGLPGIYIRGCRHSYKRVCRLRLSWGPHQQWKSQLALFISCPMCGKINLIITSKRWYWQGWGSENTNTYRVWLRRKCEIYDGINGNKSKREMFLGLQLIGIKSSYWNNLKCAWCVTGGDTAT